jgi:hypothetical protein
MRGSGEFHSSESEAEGSGGLEAAINVVELMADTNSRLTRG